MSTDVFSQGLKLRQVVCCFVNVAGQVDFWRFSLAMKNEGTFSSTDRSLQTEDGLQHVGLKLMRPAGIFAQLAV